MGEIKYLPDIPKLPVIQYTWAAGQLEETFDVETLLAVPDATQLLWRFKNVDGDYVDAGGSITHPALNQVRVSFEIAPPAGNYQLVGSTR